MAGPAMDPTAVIATRDMHAYYAPYANTNAMPADTLVLDTAWGAPYVSLGGTEGGLTYTITRTLGSIMVDQYLDPVLRPISARDVVFMTKLVEVTPELFLVAAGMGAINTVAPGVGTPGHDEMTIPASVPADVFYSMGFEAAQQNGQPWRGLIFKGMPTASPSSLIGDATKAASYEVQMTAIPPESTSTNPLVAFRKVLPGT